MRRILISVPYTDNRLFDQTVDCLLSLQAPECARVDYLLASGDDHDLADRRDRIIRKRNEARKIALSNGYDYLCFIDSDVVFHPDSLQKLYRTIHTYDAAVAYGVYCVRKEPYWWCCSLKMELDDQGMPHHYILSHDQDAARLIWNEEALHVSGIGFGMTLIRTSNLDAISFRRTDHDHQYEDYWFGYDMQQAGNLQLMNMQVRLGHILTDCKSVVWPDAATEGLYRIAPLVDYRALSQCRPSRPSKPISIQRSAWCKS